MQVINLTADSSEYTSNAYLISGDYYLLHDPNTLIDCGRDKRTMGTIEQSRTGIGKRAVEQVILTHSHFDHAGTLKDILPRYSPVVRAHPASSVPGIEPVRDGEVIRVGDNTAEIIFTPDHSDDSLCVYCRESESLFCGDSHLIIYSDDGAYPDSFVAALERITRLPVRVIYPGHGKPITGNCSRMVAESLAHVLAGRNHREN